MHQAADNPLQVELPDYAFQVKQWVAIIHNTIDSIRCMIVDHNHSLKLVKGINLKHHSMHYNQDHGTTTNLDRNATDHGHLCESNQIDYSCNKDNNLNAAHASKYLPTYYHPSFENIKISYLHCTVIGQQLGQQDHRNSTLLVASKHKLQMDFQLRDCLQNFHSQALVSLGLLH